MNGNQVQVNVIDRVMIRPPQDTDSRYSIYHSDIKSAYTFHAQMT